MSELENQYFATNNIVESSRRSPIKANQVKCWETEYSHNPYFTIITKGENVPLQWKNKLNTTLMG